MYFNEHGRPHFHAQYQNYMATFFIEGNEMCGKLPLRAMRMVEEWRDMHRGELLRNWERAREDGVLDPIEPLE